MPPGHAPRQHIRLQPPTVADNQRRDFTRVVHTGRDNSTFTIGAGEDKLFAHLARYHIACADCCFVGRFALTFATGAKVFWSVI